MLTTTTPTTPEDLARQFLTSLPDERAPWAAAFTTWAEAQRLSNEQARAIRIEVVRRRVFGATGRFQPQPRRARC